MGRWYLHQLETTEPEEVWVAAQGELFTSSDTIVVLYEHPELAKLRTLVDAARVRLAELESGYTIEKAKVDGLQARLFSRLREQHQQRERFRLVVNYRKRFLDTLLRQGEDEAEQVQREFHEATAQSDREYEGAAAAMAAKKELSGEEEAELAKLWKKLVEPIRKFVCGLQPERKGI